jgi:hypothetical protein
METRPINYPGNVIISERMSHWLSELGRHIQSCGRNIHEWISALPVKYWLSDLGVGTGKEVFKKAGWGFAAYVWQRTKARRDKLTAYLKTFRKRPTPMPVYSAGIVQLPDPPAPVYSVGFVRLPITGGTIAQIPNPGRTASIGVGFSNPEPPTSGYSLGVYQLK